MTHVLVAIGSRGDLLPQLALARALGETGTDVLVLGLDDYEAEAAAHGVPFRAVGTRLLGPVRPALLARAAQGSPAIGAAVVRRWLHAEASTLATAFLETVQQGDCLVTGILGLAPCLVLAAQRGCEVVEVVLAPTLPTAWASSLVGAPVRDSSKINLIYSHLVRRGSVAMGRPVARALRWLCPNATRTAPAPWRTVVGCSPQLVPPAPDWPDGTICVGRMSLRDPGFEPPAALRRFLQAGPAPVLIGFGSVPLRDSQGAARTWSRVAGRLGLRVLIQPAPGFDDWDGDYGGHVHLLRPTPHDWLLPQCRAIVHHGGAGTTHAAMSAGLPQGVIPFSLDQPYFASRVAALGLGPGGARPGRADAPALSRLLADLTLSSHASGYQLRARAIARAASGQDGARQAARLILGC